MTYKVIGIHCGFQHGSIITDTDINALYSGENKSLIPMLIEMLINTKQIEKI
jgi:hypothetical protein